MTTRVERYRDHCARMADAQHKPECPSLTAVEPYWPPGGWTWTDRADFSKGMSWLGPKPHWEPPKCDGCLTDDERALFAQLAGEADRYIQGDLLEDA